LSEIGEEVVVILSTHIVDDVADLCPKMAIMADGGIVAEGAPGDLIQDIEGRIWQKTIDKDEIDTYRKQYKVISARLVVGRTVVHVYAEGNPGEGFEAVPADLEDVYFATITGAHRA
jgi:ABC-2 type transport system ATP-binding protein